MKRQLLVVLATLSIAAGASAAPFKIVAHNSVKIGSLSKKAASDLFLKKTSKWENGASVVPVDQVDSSIRDAFSRAVHGKTAAAVKSYWNQQIFSGREVPPVEKRSDAEVLAFVRSTPGAVGYVSEEAVVDGVHVMSVE
jgi:ABC-type phosphate transport system substrate-binding protein